MADLDTLNKQALADNTVSFEEAVPIRRERGLSDSLPSSTTEAMDIALSAGADVNDIASVTRGQVSATETPIQTVDYAVGVGEDLDYDFPVESSKAPIPEAVASEDAAYTAVLSGQPNILEKYNEVKNSLLLDGSHPEKSSMEVALAEEQKVAAIETAALMATENFDNPNRLLNNALDSINSFRPSLADAVSERLAASAAPTTREGITIQEAFIEDMDSELSAYAELDSLVNDAKEDLELTWGMAGNALLTLLPFYENIAFTQFVSDFNLGVVPHEVVLPGEIIKRVRDKVSSLSPSERVGFFKDMSTYLMENAGVMGSNEFVRINLLVDTFAQASGDMAAEDIDWARWMTDFGGALDATMVLGPTYKGVKAVAKAARGSRMSRVIDANPQAAANLAKVIADGGESTAEMVGETAASFRAKHVMPKDAEWRIAQTPEAIRKAIVEADQSAIEALEASDRISEFVGKESKAAATALQNKLQNAEVGTVWVADTALERSGTGWRATALVANSDESGWSTLEAAKAANKAMFEGSGKIVSRERKVDHLRQVGETADGKPRVRVTGQDTRNEYFLQVEHNSKIAFTDDDFGITTGGTFNSYLFDADSRFSRTVSTKGNAVFDQYKFLEKGLESHFNPVTELSNNSKLAVSRLLSRGLQRERVYSPQEIARLARASGVKEKEVENVVVAYNEARKGFDTMYFLEERIFRQGLAKDGYSATVKGPDGFQDFGRTVNLAEASDVKRVYNPTTKTFEDVGDVKKLYDDGKELVRLRSAVRVEGEQSRYVVLDKGMSMEELPMFTLNYRKGWLPTMYKENYFITRNRKVIENGKSVGVENAVEVARTRKEALERVARLNENAEEGEQFAFKHDRRLTNAESTELQADLSRTLGKLFFSRRGDRLKHEDGSLGRIQDPLEAAVNGIRTVSRRTAMREFIDDLKTRYVNSFGDLTGHQFAPPTNVRDISSKQLAQAKSMYQYIDQLEGFSTRFDTSKALIQMADWVENLPVVGSKFAEGSRWMADRADVIGWLRAKNFELNLGTDPIRQLLLQPTQILFTAVLHPTTFVQNANAGRIITNLAKEDLSKVSIADLNTIAKRNGLGSIGIDGKQLKQLVEEFRQTGLGQAVTSHQTARDSARPLSIQASGSTLEKIGSATAAIYNTPVSWARFGFERGEEINLGAHWMLARARWMKNNPGKNPSENVLEISGEARGLALSMTQAGDFGYQRGVLSLPLQYFAIRHKSLLAMLTNKQLTKKERLAIGMAQLVMWGPEGIALGAVMDWAREEYGTDIPDVVRDGMVETFMNNALSIASGEDVDLDFAGTFSTVKGIESDNIITATLDMIFNGGDPSKIMFGATKSNYNRISNFMESAGITLKTTPHEINWDIASIAKDDFIKILSSMNRMMQGHAMLASGQWQNSKGEAVFPASTWEAVLHGTLGLQSNKVEAIYELSQYINPPGMQRTTALEDSANAYYRVALQLANKYLDDYKAGGNLQELQARHKAVTLILCAIKDSAGPDAPVIMKKVQDKIENNFRGSKGDELIQALSTLYMDRGNATLIDIAEQDGIIQPEQAETFKEMYNFMWDIK